MGSCSTSAPFASAIDSPSTPRCTSRHPLWEGSSETAAVASALLSDLVERGLDVEQGLLFVLDGSKRAALGPIRRFSFIRRRGCRNRRLGSSVDRADNLFPVGRDSIAST